jgi:hypothetical protein
MKRLLTTATMSGILAVAAFAGPAMAGKPASPGCFGTDRAAYIHTNFQGGGALDTAPGASEWGAIAGERASTNGDQNRAYKTACGGDSTP